MLEAVEVLARALAKAVSRAVDAGDLDPGIHVMLAHSSPTGAITVALMGDVLTESVTFAKALSP